MTIGQYLASFSILAALTVLGLLAASRRGNLALVAAALAFSALAAAWFWIRSARAHETSAPKPMVVALVAIFVASAVVYVRRSSGGTSGRLLTGVLAWVGLVFAWFETAYLLR